jgi:hypothetical protein
MAQKYLFISCFVILCGLNASAQRKIAVEHDGTCTFFDDIPTAVAAAMSGDTIYLPGGSFPGFNIDKKLTIVGVGHNPESTEATGMTLISSGILMITSDCDGSVFTGLRVNGNINNGNNTTENDNVQISRCFVVGGIYAYSGTGSENWTISECIINVINDISNSFVSNSLIVNSINPATNCQIENNIFLYPNNYVIVCDASTFKNNIFYNFTNSNNAISNTLFYNNIWSNGSLTNGIFGIGNIGYDNINDTDFSGLFTNFLYTTYNNGNIDYLYECDFHLINPTYDSGGTNGTAIGIYGGGFPWKEGSIPFNPHIQSKQIGPTTDPSGNLNVNIQVEAQDN